MKILMAISLSIVCQSTLAEVIDQPIIHIGDTWVYHDTIASHSRAMSDMKPGKLVATSSDAEKIELTFVPSTPDGSQKTYRFNPDWSVSKTTGESTNYSFYPLSFPLWIGKKWSRSSSSKHRGPVKSGQVTETIYTTTISDNIVGPEEIDVPAGRFQALRIEEERTSGAIEKTLSVNLPGQDEDEVVLAIKNYPAKLTAIQTLWYVPEVKRWVKLYREEFTLLKRRHLTELESFTPAK